MIGIGAARIYTPGKLWHKLVTTLQEFELTANRFRFVLIKPRGWGWGAASVCSLQYLYVASSTDI